MFIIFWSYKVFLSGCLFELWSVVWVHVCLIFIVMNWVCVCVWSAEVFKWKCDAWMAGLHPPKWGVKEMDRRLLFGRDFLPFCFPTIIFSLCLSFVWHSQSSHLSFLLSRSFTLYIDGKITCTTVQIFGVSRGFLFLCFFCFCFFF